MKKIIPIILIVAIGFGLFIWFTSPKNGGGTAIDKTAQDYEKIEKARSAMAKLAVSSEVKSFGNQAAWYIFDVRAVDQHDEGFYKALKKELGDDFDSQLSNGDFLFVGVYPSMQKYRVYAGDPNASDTMLYPDWKYTKLEKK